MTLVPPYDHPCVMAGQGTVALELLADTPDLELLVVPVGGGGLIAGCSTAAKALRPRIRVVGVEPEGGDDTKQSLAKGERVALAVPRTIADGLQATTPGELTFEVNSRLVDEVVTVTDAQLVDAMRFAFDRLKLVIEPSGAVGLAALLNGAIPEAKGRRVGVVISGGNVGAARFAELIAAHRDEVLPSPRRQHLDASSVTIARSLDPDPAAARQVDPGRRRSRSTTFRATTPRPGR